MLFRLAHGPLCFEIPDDWWRAAGADAYRRDAPHFRCAGPAVGDELTILPLVEIAPPLRNPAAPLDHHGLRRLGLGGTAGGMFGVLCAITSGASLPPVAVCKTRSTYSEGFNYRVHDGFHRFYASHAIGFSHLPCVIAHDVRERPVFGDMV